MATGKIVCFNDRYIPAGEAAVPATDQGLLYGMGIFETVRVSGELPRLVGLHLTRLLKSAGELGLEVPYSPGAIEEMLYRTAQKNSIKEGGLRLTLTAGGDQCRPSLLVQSREQTYSEEMYRCGIRAGFVSFRRNEKSPLVRHKTLNYYENIMARRLAASSGWGEALFLNCSGNLAEGSVSNVFLVRDGRVITPVAESGLLPGITRRRVMDACAFLKIPLEERVVPPGELYGAGECFLTNSLMGVMPLTLLENTPIGSGAPGEITRLVASEMERLDDIGV